MAKKLTELQLKRAKSLYMAYCTQSDIASRLGVPKTTIQYHIDKYWRSERVLKSQEIASQFSESKISRMNNTFSASFRALEEWVRIKADNPEELKAHEAKALMDIISNMDKIMRLDAGSPTDIIEETKPVDVIEIRKKILKADPFLVDADFKEVKDDSKNS